MDHMGIMTVSLRVVWFVAALLCLALLHPFGSGAQAAERGRVVVHEGVDFAPVAPLRRVWVYLPPGYDAAPDQRWPVIYLHDGQNLFDEKTSFSGEWRVDETVDGLVAGGRTRGLIVVGVDNGGDARLSEYAPWPFVHAPQAKGELHARAMARAVKPFIDRTYRTDPDPSVTAIGGSSMGAVMAVYTAFAHPDAFGRVLAMSGSWVEDWMMADLRRWMAGRPKAPPHVRVWLDMGVREWRGDADAAVRGVAALLQGAGVAADRIAVTVDPDGEHNEASWARRLPDALLWLYP